MDHSKNDDIYEIGNGVNFAVTSTSTYPYQGTNKFGDPVADAFAVCFYPDSTILCICDGCGWGVGSAGAAQKASRQLVKTLSAFQEDFLTVNKIGAYLLRALDDAHSAILNGAQKEGLGTTTLLGGVIVQVSQDSFKLIHISVGDCKVFRYRPTTKELVDLTGTTRDSLDIRDTGGRLGATTSIDLKDIKYNIPEIGNLAIKETELLNGDLLFFLSDGVHDNFTPLGLGEKPGDHGLKFNTWFDMPLEEANDFLGKWQIEKMKEFINSQKNIDPITISRGYIDYVNAITANSRKSMQENSAPPKQRPGKMDHSTAVVYCVGSNENYKSKNGKEEEK